MGLFMSFSEEYHKAIQDASDHIFDNFTELWALTYKKILEENKYSMSHRQLQIAFDFAICKFRESKS